WRTAAGSKGLSISFARDPEGGVVAPEPAACVERRLAQLQLPEPAALQAVGFARLMVEPAAQEARERPQAHTWLGYELLVSASREGKELGSTRLRIAPGSIP